MKARICSGILFSIFLLMLFFSVSVNAQSEVKPVAEVTEISDSNNPDSIIGLYKTELHKFYYEQYGTKQYSTLEFKENNRAELRVITDNTESDQRSSRSSCHIFQAVDYLEYKIVEDGEIELTCVGKEEGWCEANTKSCFDYILPATITENGIRIRNDIFIKE